MTYPVVPETELQKHEREQKQAYLLELPFYDKGNFALPNNEIDGLLPSARVESWRDLLAILQGPDFKKTKNDLIYRGQRGHDWQLASTLGRVFQGGEIPGEKSDRLLKEFRLSMRGRGYDLAPFEDPNEVWAVGQHYGLRTPLLDWTRSPFVALFFAFSKYENAKETAQNPSRAIFCLNKTALEEDLGADSVQSLFLEPEDHRNSRLVNQSGLFTVAPDGQDNLVSFLVNELDRSDLLGSVDETRAVDTANPFEEILTKSFSVNDTSRAKYLSRYIFKLHIPNSIEDRKDCLEALRQMNIHHGNLFPDPGGASEFCNDWLERLLEDEKNEEVEKQKAEKKKIFAEITKPVTGVGIEARIKQIAPLYMNIELDEQDNFASLVKSKVDNATSLDWQRFPVKRVIVKRAIRRAISNSGFSLRADQSVDKLIDILLDEFAKSAEEGNA